MKIIQAVVNQSPVNTRSGTEEEALKKQLEESQQVINELQNKIQRLAIENTELKSRIKSQNVDDGDEDELVELWVKMGFVVLLSVLYMSYLHGNELWTADECGIDS